jgi:hypothetical protein
VIVPCTVTVDFMSKAAPPWWAKPVPAIARIHTRDNSEIQILRFNDHLPARSGKSRIVAEKNIAVAAICP